MICVLSCAMLPVNDISAIYPSTNSSTVKSVSTKSNKNQIKNNQTKLIRELFTTSKFKGGKNGWLIY